MASGGTGTELVGGALQGYSGPQIAFESTRGVATEVHKGSRWPESQQR